jgi:hypothetical protein
MWLNQRINNPVQFGLDQRRAVLTHPIVVLLASFPYVNCEAQGVARLSLVIELAGSRLSAQS